MNNFISFFRSVFCVLCLLSFSTIDHNQSIELILDNLDSYVSNASPDKVYLHTDRSIYALEDTIWLKAYVNEGVTHMPTKAGKVVYVDVIDDVGNKVLDKKLYAENIGAASDIFIERDWKPGSYSMRGYTRFMLNQDPKYIFSKNLEIVDIKKANDELYSTLVSKVTTENTRAQLDIKFYPESGELVAGIDSRVAIKLDNYPIDKNGLTGNIEDENGKLMASFKIYERGYGLAAFTPVAGMRYFARIENDPIAYALPDVKTQGYIMTAIIKANTLSVIVSSNIDSGLSSGDILVHNRGRLILHKKLTEDVDNAQAIKFDTNEFPSGVTHFTFFDREGVPRCERLVFIDNTNSEVTISSDEQVYNKRDKVNINLSIDSMEQATYDCSVAVIDLSNVQGAKPSDNIKSWMLLNSDLRGEIENPAYYFEKRGDVKRAYLLDLVMMTHGWRRFTWDDLSKSDALKDLEHERESGLYVKGHVGKIWNTKAPVKSKVMLNFLDDNLTQVEMVTDEDGRFAFGPFIIVDSTNAIIQASRYKEDDKDIIDGNRNVTIHLDRAKAIKIEPVIIKSDGEFDYDAYKTYINNSRSSQAIKDQYHSMEVMLSEIVLIEKKKTEADRIDQIAKDRSYYSNPSNRVILTDMDRSSSFSILDMLRTIPGVNVVGSYPNQTVTIRGISSINASITPLYILDGVPVDESFVNQISPNEVLFIDVLKGANASIYGSRAGSGVIAIYTGANSDNSVKRRKPGIIDITVYGFATNREFYSPDYARDVSRVYASDVRTTLYWDPYVSVENNKDATMSFYTGDNPGKYIVITEGLSDVGEPIFGTYEFSVQ